ncbi:MAG: hypothetical protein GTO16_11795 [Candidatus Aminicenantes bacterium]|nr:hypothetical protein [Candidatus Aminicenantes bacterium]
MAKRPNVMDKFDFLLGTWNLESNVPKSAFSEAAKGVGIGTFKRALNDKYVYFDYSGSLTTGDKAGKEGGAHGIFAWDEKTNILRYWWFESSGTFMEATCNFVNNDTLFLNWHDTLITQTFTKVSSNKVILRMEHPVAKEKFELILEVIFTRK